MGKRHILYVVYAGNYQGCSPVYESTKRDKAEKFAHDLMKSETDYSKIFITTVNLVREDKRAYEEDEDY